MNKATIEQTRIESLVRKAVEDFKSALYRVPNFSERVNKETRVKLSEAHSIILNIPALIDALSSAESQPTHSDVSQDGGNADKTAWMIERKACGAKSAMWWNGYGDFADMESDEGWTTDPNAGIVFPDAPSATSAFLALLRHAGLHTSKAKEKREELIKRVTITEHMWMDRPLLAHFEVSKKWLSEKLATCDDTNAAAGVFSQPALTDEQIAEIGLAHGIHAFKSAKFRADRNDTMTLPEREDFDAHIAFARALLSAPAQAAVEPKPTDSSKSPETEFAYKAAKTAFECGMMTQDFVHARAEPKRELLVINPSGFEIWIQRRSDCKWEFSTDVWGNTPHIASPDAQAIRDQALEDARQCVANASVSAGYPWHPGTAHAVQKLLMDAIEDLKSQAPQPAQEEQHYDDYAVDEFAKLMRAKMAASRAKGRSGWEDPKQCSVAYLQTLFHEHVEKGDPIDVANICMMLYHYQATTKMPFDVWLEKPYTKVLQKSIREDYVPKEPQPSQVKDAPASLTSGEGEVRLATEPDWSNSKTGDVQLWKNPLFPMNDRLLMADGAIAFRDKVIANLRSQLAALTQPAAEADERELPPLPETTYNGYADGSEPLYTADQMHAYAKAALAQSPAKQGPQFEVRIDTYNESHRTTYWVQIINRTLRGNERGILDQTGMICPHYFEDREHAVHTAKEWAAVLGVEPPEPCHCLMCERPAAAQPQQGATK